MTPSNETRHTVVRVTADGIATLEISNAGVLNLLNSSVLADVSAVVSELAARSNIRVLVIRGTGDRAFIGGADIKEMVGLRPQSARAFITKVAALCEALREFPTPVIARLPGWCLGAGLEVAAACDLRIASNNAHFGMPEVAVGIPSVVHAVLLPRLIGSARARWLMLTARSIDAGTALMWGLIDELVESPEDLDAAVARTATLFVEYGPEAVRKQKMLLNRWEDMSMHLAIADSIDEFASSFATGEPQRFMGEFLDRKTRKSNQN